ncbi:MAG TPA: NYN domain-containing protein [Candidatus Paceibacterota bacterium]|nr:NYN domain-containing protein [Candidatus Paceibacterota bacterium]
MTDRITIKPRPNHRVGFFVDMQNLYHSAKHLHNSRINFAELLKLAVQGRQVVRSLVYVVKGGESPEEQAFFDALEKSGLELKMKDLQVFAGGAKKADWDVGMAVDAISMAKQLDVVILATGDGDFVPLVQYLQNNGTIVEAISFGRSTSMKLKEAVNNFTDLDEHKKVLLRIPLRRGKPTKASEKKEADRATAGLSGFMPSRIKHEE